MTKQQRIDAMNEALQVLAAVCDQHVATPKEHRKIAEHLQRIAQDLAELVSKLPENTETQ